MILEVGFKIHFLLNVWRNVVNFGAVFLSDNASISGTSISSQDNTILPFKKEKYFFDRITSEMLTKEFHLEDDTANGCTGLGGLRGLTSTLSDQIIVSIS
jgi:hypothetical protein